jgi:hypothetical protein
VPCVSSSAASEVSLARLGSRIIRAMESSAARVETAESVANRSGIRGVRAAKAIVPAIEPDDRYPGRRSRDPRTSRHRDVAIALVCPSVVSQAKR